MTQQDATTPGTPPPTPTGSSDRATPDSAAAKPRRARKWLIGIGIVVLLLILVVALLPTIAGTGPVRSFVLGRVNDSIPGRLVVDDWSLGWFSGISLTGMELYDEQDAQILAVPRLTTDLGLLQAITGDLDLGQTIVDVNLTQLVRDEEGRTNIERALGVEPAPAAPKTDGPTTVPDLRGQITVNILGGTIVSPEIPQPVHLQPGSAVVNITNINQPIENAINLKYHVGEGTTSTITAKGTIDVIEDYTVAVDQLKADQSLTLANVDAAALSAFVPLTMQGMVNGQLALKANGLADLTATGEFIAENPAFSGGPFIGDDRFASEQVKIPVSIAQRDVNGLPTLVVEKLAVESDELTVQVTGQVPQSAIENLVARKAPGATGELRVTTSVPDLTVLNQLNETIGLPAETQFTSGNVRSELVVGFVPERVNVSHVLDAQATATQAGETRQIEPIHSEVRATVQIVEQIADVEQLSLSMPQSRAIALNVAGRVADWDDQRNLDLTADVGYDLERLWEMAQPFLAPETRESLKDMDIGGQFQRQWTIAGSLPATRDGQPIEFAEAMRSLDVTGGLGLTRFIHQGIDLRDFELDLTLDDARVALATPAGATFNSGALSFQGTLDLRGEVPRLSTPRRVPLVRDATINPLLGDTIGKYVNPIFANASRAQGLLNVTINQCQNLALGEALMTEQSGQAVVTFSLTEMQIANPMGSLILGQIAQRLSEAGLDLISVDKGVADAFYGEIRDAVITIEDGRTTQQLTMNLADPKRAADVVGAPRSAEPSEPVPLTFTGDIRLSDLEQNISVALPSRWLSQRIGGDVGQFIETNLPEGVPLTLRGTATAPKPVFGDALWATLTQAFRREAQRRIMKEANLPPEASDILGNILGGGGQRQQPQQGGNTTTQPAPEQPNPLGGLLDQLNRRRQREPAQDAPQEDIGQQRIDRPRE